jgi:glycosyltransferase involved in cell wall biosynthesis
LCCNNKPTIIFDHALGGGANDYREQLIADRLAEGQPCILVTYSEAGGGLELTARLGATTYKLAMESSAELTNLPPFTRGAEIVYNNIVGWPHTDEALESLTLLARRRNVYARILIHDYYPVCPSYTLLDKNDVFCGVPADTRACEACLRSNRHAATQADIISWRGGWRRLFDASAEVVCFSEASAALVLRSYPDLRTPVVVRPHRALTSYDARQSWTPPNGPLVIGAFGDFGFQKGAQVLSQMAKLLEGHSPHAKIVIFGSIDPAWHEARPNMVIHGRYRREEIPDLLRRYSVAVCVVPSIWPETFSYVTQELMLLGVPLASFNIGAQGERIQHYKRGAVAPGFTALSLLDTVTTLHDRNRQVT